MLATKPDQSLSLTLRTFLSIRGEGVTIGDSSKSHGTFIFFNELYWCREVGASASSGWSTPGFTS
jgi:hypothetical protein